MPQQHHYVHHHHQQGYFYGKRFANPSEKRRNASQITSSFGVEEETGFESTSSLSGGEGDYNSNCQPYQSTQQCNSGATSTSRRLHHHIVRQIYSADRSGIAVLAAEERRRWRRSCGRAAADREMEDDAANAVHSDVEEDDPGRLLNAWLGELDSLKKGLDSPTKRQPDSQGLAPQQQPHHPYSQTTSNGGDGMSSVECSPGPHTPNGVSSAPLPPVLRRRNNARPENQQKVQFRRSLINIEEAAQDDELDAILGELSVLGSQLESEIGAKLKSDPVSEAAPTQTVATANGGQDSDNSLSSHSRSSSGESGQIKQSSPVASSAASAGNKKSRTDSPDNDSAFCDNLSVLSSCSSSSKNLESKTSSSGVSSSASPSSALAPTTIPSSSGMPGGAQVDQEEEARIKAEKIKLAIEKIKEANVKKIFVKVFAADGSAKSLLVDEKMSVGHVTRILAEKNHVKLDPKWAIVELIPELYMERVYEDHENLVENCLMWKVDSKNTLWFIERPEKFDLFLRPELYLLGSSSSQKGDLMEEHARQELLEEYFSSSGVGAPEGVEGFLWLKAESKKSWKKFYFVLRSSGLYYAPKGKKTSKDLVCLATFDVNQVYYGSNWKKKYKSPTDFCFAIKHPQIQAKSPKYTKYLCVESERELHQWVTAIRIAKNSKQLYDNYRGIEEEITHADIDILTSKRFSSTANTPSGGNAGNASSGAAVAKHNISTGGLMAPPPAATSSPARTPMSENKSFDSALSSGIISDAGCSSQSEAGNSNIPDSEVTPVNTIQRHPGHNQSASSIGSSNQNSLQRSMSRSSNSSSSGCLSSGSGQPFVPNGLSLDHSGGFDSDYPMGGTIKKRPQNGSSAGVARLPLTNTTWGLVSGTNVSHDEEEEEQSSSSNSVSGDSTSNSNVRIGGGGTLLRSAVKQSTLLRKPPLAAELQQVQVHAQVHAVHGAGPDPQVDPISAQFESSLMVTSMTEDDIPLPPPPMRSAAESLAPLHDDVDDLPPPPPPEICDQIQHSKPSLPQTLPLQHTPPKKKISFNDNVQLIPESPATEKRYFFQREVYSAQPKKLFSPASNNTANTPPREFLKDLQRVMTKKWQVAEKCKESRAQPNGNFVSPAVVLGFRDPEFLGVEQNYSRDESVGAWILQNAHQYSTNDQQLQRQQQQRQLPAVPSEPLYAVSSHKRQPSIHQTPQQLHQVQQHQVVTNTAANHQLIMNGNGIGGPGLPPHHPNANPGHAHKTVPGPQGTSMGYVPQPPLTPIRSNVPTTNPPVPQPVVLREPTPEYETLTRRQQQPQQQLTAADSSAIYGTYHPATQQVNNYAQSNLYYPVNNAPPTQPQMSPQPPPQMSPHHHQQQQVKRAPPPPRRSENTHLTTK